MVAAAWTNGLSVKTAQRLLLGYIEGPADTAASWKIFGVSASGLDDNRMVNLTAAPARQ